MTDELNTHSMAGPTACPFVAYEDDRDHRSDAPDYRHRCFASAEPEPRAFPHQERYCLSAGFTACPIFLDWARQEAAGINRTESSEDASAPAPIEDEAAAPAFLASRSRTAAPAEVASSASRRTAEASAGLWSNEGISRRNVPTAPPPPNTVHVPQVAMARRGPTHPGWENPPRLENFPRLRSRDERHSNAIFMTAVIGVAIVMVGLVLLPVLLSRGGGSSTPNPALLSPSNIAAATPSPTVTPTPGPTPFLYTVGDPKKDPNLTVIASRYNVTPAMIISYNQALGSQFQIKNANVIWKGMQFYIPPPGWTPPPATPTPAPTDTPAPSTSAAAS